MKSFYSNAQSITNDFGAKSKGVGNSNTAIADEWSIFNNAGGMSALEHVHVFFGYDRYHRLEGFDKVAAGIIHPMKFGNIGIALFRFGDELFSESTISMAYGNKIGFVRLGAKVNYYQLRIDEFGTAGAMFFDLGGIVELVPDLSFGAFISNFSSAKLSNVERSELPVVMKIGLSYTPVRKLSVNLDVYKDVRFMPMIKAGIEYIIAEKLYLRTGVNTNPFQNFFGIGISLDPFNIDYAVSNHDFLGLSHQAGISFTYYKKGEK
ncbi:MAG: hypothetical protein MI975_19565 [Cytophagales bacterium]|nr:hypothetical protein [Cytophagales bacterium]